MVGLPARGKRCNFRVVAPNCSSYIARKISRYLKWVGVPTQIFNVGSYRRERLGTNQNADFFDPNNTYPSVSQQSTVALPVSVMAPGSDFIW